MLVSFLYHLALQRNIRNPFEVRTSSQSFNLSTIKIVLNMNVCRCCITWRGSATSATPSRCVHYASTFQQSEVSRNFQVCRSISTRRWTSATPSKCAALAATAIC